MNRPRTVSPAARRASCGFTHAGRGRGFNSIHRLEANSSVMSGRRGFFSNRGWHSGLPPQPSRTVVASGSEPQTLTGPAQMEQPPRTVSRIVTLFQAFGSSFLSLSRVSGLLILGTCSQYQLHLCSFYNCSWTSWAGNKDHILLCSIHKDTAACRGCVHLTVHAQHVNRLTGLVMSPHARF